MREEDIPIDINYNKLLDWLIDRRHCNLKWQQKVVSVQDKISKTMKNMPENEDVTQLLKQPYLNFFNCLQIKKRLEESGEGNKNIFGQYSSQIMKDWSEILQLYQSENIYLAETSAQLIRNVNYEIPSLKKQIAKCQQTQRDSNRKESEYVSNAAMFKEKYLLSCKDMGIKGEDIKRELLNLVSELPAIHCQIAEEVKELADAIEYYGEFTNFVMSSASAKNGFEEIQVSPLTHFLVNNGNATVYQWKTGEVPEDAATDIKQNIVDENSRCKGHQEEELVIDWGDLVDTNDVETQPATTASEIDWGSVDAVTGDMITDLSEQEPGIDWEGCIEVVEDAVDDTGKIEVVDDQQKSGSITNTTHSGTILDNVETRNQFIDELLELQSFLSQRLVELEMDSDVISANQFQSAPVLLQLQTKEKVMEMHKKVTGVIEDLGSRKMRNLYLLKSSERFVHRIADSLQQQLKISENMVRQARLAADRRKDAIAVQKECEPKLHILVQKTKELQNQIAEEISKRYKNRVVNIMGEINTI